MANIIVPELPWCYMLYKFTYETGIQLIQNVCHIYIYTLYIVTNRYMHPLYWDTEKKTVGIKYTYERHILFPMKGKNC